MNLELTPRVTPNGDIVLEMAAEFSLPGGGSELAGQNLPTFLTRNVNGTLRLRDGETALLGGLLQDSEIETFSGIIGLQSIPLVNRVLTGTKRRKTQTEILFSITPHLVRAPKISEEDLRSMFIGTQEVLRVPGGDVLFGAPEPSPSPTAGRPRRRPAPRRGGPRAPCRPRCPTWTRCRRRPRRLHPRPRCRRRCRPGSRRTSPRRRHRDPRAGAVTVAGPLSVAAGGPC